MPFRLSFSLNALIFSLLIIWGHFDDPVIYQWLFLFTCLLFSCLWSIFYSWSFICVLVCMGSKRVLVGHSKFTSDLWPLKWISIKPQTRFFMSCFYCQMAVSLLHFCIQWSQSSICFRLVCHTYYCQSKKSVLMYLFHQGWFVLFRLVFSLNALIFLLLLIWGQNNDSDFTFLRLCLFLNLSVLCPDSQSKISIFRDYPPLNSYFSNLEK